MVDKKSIAGLIDTWRQIGSTTENMKAVIACNGAYFTFSEAHVQMLKKQYNYEHIYSIFNLDKIRGIIARPMFFDTCVIATLCREEDVNFTDVRKALVKKRDNLTRDRDFLNAAIDNIEHQLETVCNIDPMIKTGSA